MFPYDYALRGLINLHAFLLKDYLSELLLLKAVQFHVVCLVFSSLIFLYLPK